MIFSKKSLLPLSIPMLALALLAVGCQKKVSFKEGDLVYAQYYQGEGNFWEPAKVAKVQGEEITVKWDDTFAKSDSMTSKHVSEVVKRERPDPKKLKEGSVILIHHPSFLYPYKGEITKIEGNRYTVKYMSGSVEREDNVDIDALWKYK